MAKRLLFIQGGGEGVHDEWDNRLVESLERALGADYQILYPRMPDEADPRFAPWKAAIHEALGQDRDLVVVGHSIGATVLIHALVEEPPKHPPAGVFLVAPPFIGEGGWASDDIDPKANLGAKLPAGTPIYLYQGDADDTVPVAHLDLNIKAIPQAVARNLPGRDHQLNDDLSEVAADIHALTRREPS